MGKVESNENDLALSEKEVSEEQLLQQVRERSILLNLDLFKEADGEEKEEKEKNNLLPVKKEEEISEEDAQEAELFSMPMSMDNTNRPARICKTKKDIYDYMSIEIKPQNYRKYKNDLMDIDFSRQELDRVEKSKPKDSRQRKSIQERISRDKPQIRNSDLSNINKKRVFEEDIAKNWFEIKAEAEVKRIMDIYYCKNIESKWKLPL